MLPSSANDDLNSPPPSLILTSERTNAGNKQVTVKKDDCSSDSNDGIMNQSGPNIPVVIDLTVTSDDDTGDEEDFQSSLASSDSDIEIISHRSRSPITISSNYSPGTVPNDATVSNSGNTSQSLDRDFSVIQRNRIQNDAMLVSFASVNPVSSFASQNDIGNGQMNQNSFQRPVEDIIDWLDGIEPLNPFSSVASSNGQRSSSNINSPSVVRYHDRSLLMECRNCGCPMHSRSQQIGQPSTSSLHPPNNPPSLSSSRLEESISSSRTIDESHSVLERILSTPPLPTIPAAEERFNNGAAINASSVPPFQFQPFSPNLLVPPPAHTNNNFRFSSLSRPSMPINVSASEYQPPSEFRPINTYQSVAFDGMPSHSRGGAPFLDLLRVENILNMRRTTYNPQPTPQNVDHFVAQPRLSSHRPVNQPMPTHPAAQFLRRSMPMEFLPPVFVHGFYPDFPGFGLTPNQIEKHTVKYTLKRKVDDVDEPISAKKPKSSFADEDEASCSVCLDGFENDQILRRLACEHLFHADCVDEWLRRRPTCPNCRIDVRRRGNNNDNNNATRPPAQASSSVSNINIDNRFIPFSSHGDSPFLV